MKILKVKIFTICILVILLVSCEKTIEFESSLMKPKIVVNSVLSSNSKYTYVVVQKSRSVLSEINVFEALPNAEVKFFENGVFVKQFGYSGRVDTFYNNMGYGVVEKIPFENGIFIDSTINIQPGSTYRLEVSSEGLDPVFCETTVPERPDLLEINVVKELKPTEFNKENRRVNIELKFKDNPNKDNYYRLILQQRMGVERALINFNRGFGGYFYGGYGQYYGGSISDYIQSANFVKSDTIVENSISSFLFSSDPVLNPNGNTDILNSNEENIEYFSDELISSETYTLNFWNNLNTDIYTELGEYLEVSPFIEEVSFELYQYMKTKQKQLDAQDNPFAEPVPVFSNVVGGMGIFGSKNMSMISTIIGDYPVEGKTYIDYYTFQQIYYRGSYY